MAGGLVQERRVAWVVRQRETRDATCPMAMATDGESVRVPAGHISPHQALPGHTRRAGSATIGASAQIISPRHGRVELKSNLPAASLSVSGSRQAGTVATQGPKWRAAPDGDEACSPIHCPRCRGGQCRATPLALCPSQRVPVFLGRFEAPGGQCIGRICIIVVSRLAPLLQPASGRAASLDPAWGECVPGNPRRSARSLISKLQLFRSACFYNNPILVLASC